MNPTEFSPATHLNDRYDAGAKQYYDGYDGENEEGGHDNALIPDEPLCLLIITVHYDRNYILGRMLNTNTITNR